MKIMLLALLYSLSILVGLYKAFIIQKCFIYFLPQYSALLSLVQMWAILVIYQIITTKHSEYVSTDNDDFSTILTKAFNSLSVKGSALSITWLSMYIIKSMV